MNESNTHSLRIAQHSRQRLALPNRRLGPNRDGLAHGIAQLNEYLVIRIQTNQAKPRKLEIDDHE